jgi:hypothetical protein
MELTLSSISFMVERQGIRDYALDLPCAGVFGQGFLYALSRGAVLVGCPP